MRPALAASSANLRRDAEDDARGFTGCAQLGFQLLPTPIATTHGGRQSVVACSMLVLYMPLSESKELKYLKEKATPQRRIRL
jgi:hypothetical protein